MSKKNIKLMASAFCALTFITSVFAAGTTVATAKAGTVDTVYNAGEVGVSLSSGYTLDTSALFSQDYTFNLTGGAFWFPFRNFGIEANVPFYQTKGVSVDEVQFGLLARLPLAKEVPVFKNLAPYLGVGGVYNWDMDEELAYIGKAGLEFRLNEKWGVFVEGQFRNTDFTWDDGNRSLQGGLKLVF